MFDGSQTLLWTLKRKLGMLRYFNTGINIHRTVSRADVANIN